MEKMLEQKIQQFTDQTEQQRDSNKIWEQSLGDNLLKLVYQNKVDATISESRHKEKLKLWKRGLEQKIQEFVEQHEQPNEKCKTWQHDLEETLALKTQELIGHRKQQREANEGWRQELEKMLEQRIQQFTDQTEYQKESNEDWKQGLGENLFKLIKVK